MRILVVFLMVVSHIFAIEHITKINYEGFNKRDMERMCQTITSSMGTRFADCMVNGITKEECQKVAIIALNFTNIGNICDEVSIDPIKEMDEAFEKTYKLYIESAKKAIQEQANKDKAEMQKILKEMEELIKSVERR